MKRAPQAAPAAALGGLLLCGCSHLVAGMSSSGVRSMGVGETVEAGGGAWRLPPPSAGGGFMSKMHQRCSDLNNYGPLVAPRIDLYKGMKTSRNGD